MRRAAALILAVPVMAVPVMAVLVIAVLVMAACRPASDRRDPDGVPVGRSTRTIEVDGRPRTFHLYRPAALPARPALVVMLHGGLGSASQAEAAYHWDAKADAHGFLVAYPDGLGRAWAAGGGCCGLPGRTGVDDVAFIERMVADLQAALPVDAGRVYATGMSNGGMMAYRLACDSTLFAAIGPVAGTLLGPCPDRAPVSVIHVHGLADRRVRYDGAPGEGVARIDGPPIPEVIAAWRAAAGCDPPTERTAGPVTVSTAGCPAGRAVELVTVAGAGHQWPGAVPRETGGDPPATALDATDAIWRFFAAHPKPA